MKTSAKRVKLEKILKGERVLASDVEMSFFEAEVDNYPILLSLASVYNPDCTGLKDRYISFLKSR